MIVLNLICKKCDNEFEGWFSSSQSCANQIKKKMVECTSCYSTKIEKSLSKPNVTVHKGKSKRQNEASKILKSKLRDIKNFVKDNCEYVGDQFPYEARRIHYDNLKKPIYGHASKKEAAELKEEGIETTSIPWIKEEN
tara:strand:- start:734 stop:1147 length:414 start_codon:yes stop_codon:yes gene_type:complete